MQGFVETNAFGKAINDKSKGNKHPQKDDEHLLQEEDDEDEIVKIRNRKSKKTLNQILDKIYDKGIDSIDEDEKQILKANKT